MFKALRLLSIAAIAMLVSACGSMPTFSTESTGAKLVVQVATMKYIEREDLPAERAARAAKITRGADEVSVMLDMEGVTVADLRAKALERIAAADLEVSDKLVLTALVDMINDELDEEIGDGVISPDQRVTVNVVFSWVKQAASFYV